MRDGEMRGEGEELEERVGQGQGWRVRGDDVGGVKGRSEYIVRYEVVGGYDIEIIL